MPIKAESADGVSHEFPDGTAPEVVDRVMKQYAEEHKDKSTSLGELGTGIMDPIEGGGQLISNILPARVERTLNEANNWLADKLPGFIRKLPEGGKNEQMRQREADITAQRGSNTGMDWPRMAGNILSPVNYIGVGAFGEGEAVASAARSVLGAKTGAGAANIARGVVGGASAGALQPATSDDYSFEKMLQTGVGGVTGGALGVGGEMVGRGVQGIQDYLARNNPEILQNTAVQKILNRIGQDHKAGGPSATDAIDLVNAGKGPWGPRPGAKPLALADVTGENTRGLAGNVSRQPGPAREWAKRFLGKRDEQAASRLSQDIQSNLSGGPTMFQATQALLSARSAASKPLYDAVHNLQNIWSPRLEQFLQDPTIKSGLARGYELERLQSLADGRPLTATQMGIDIGVDGSAKILDKPNMLLLDMAKRGVDAMIADERNAITGRLSARGVALDNMRRAYVKTIDDLDTNGVYKKARDAWAGPSASMDAVKLGRNVFNMSPEENASEVENLSPANREFYRVGVADMLKERLSRAGLNADEAKALIKNPWMRDQLKPAFKSDEDFDKFVDAVTTETKMFQTGVDILGNSKTAARGAEDASADHGMLSGGGAVAEKIAKGQLFGAAKTAYQMWHDLGLQPNPELNEKIAKILFTSDLPQDVVKQILQGGRKITTPSRGAAVARGLGSGMSPTIATDATKERSPQGTAQ